MSDCIECGEFPQHSMKSGLCIRCERVLVPDSGFVRFKRYDDDKPRTDLIPVELLDEMGEVTRHEAHDWNLCEDPGRYETAIAKHWLAYLSGQEIDPDSGLSHLAYCVCLLGMLFPLVVGGAVTRLEGEV